TWDGNQRLAAARVARGTAASTTTYGYDPLGRRIFKETLGRRTRFAWDGLALLADAVDGQVREFVYRPGSVVPWYVMNTSAGVTDRRAYLTDPNGMPTRLIDSRGHTSWVSASSPHAAIAAPPDDVQPLRAPGQYSDLETELVYNLHRYFDPD